MPKAEPTSTYPTIFLASTSEEFEASKGSPPAHVIPRTRTYALLGLEAHEVEVEVDSSRGMPNFRVVGLPDAAVSEARERVRSAILSSDLEFPPGRLTINLAPADLRKVGPGFDLAMALGIAATLQSFPASALETMASVGELALDGRVRGLPGVLSAALAHRRLHPDKVLLVPRENAAEAAQVRGLRYLAVEHFTEALQALRAPLCPQLGTGMTPMPRDEADSAMPLFDYADVLGQAQGCRAMQVIAGGGHNALLVGPPGSGKTMLAQRLPGILPPLGEDEALVVRQIYSAAKLSPETERGWIRRPFRAPHHSCSAAGLVGGGSVPKPGELSLAHSGVLFLDEALEFSRPVLESLRQPLEYGRVTLSRAQASVELPARIILVLAVNPCPCGFYGDTERACRCSEPKRLQYRSRLSGPLLDRLDVHLEVPRRRSAEEGACKPGPTSKMLAYSVQRARDFQSRRYAGLPTEQTHNATAAPGDFYRRVDASDSVLAFLQASSEQLGWSRRAQDRVLRVARTIADLDASDTVRREHVLESIALRRGSFDSRP